MSDDLKLKIRLLGEDAGASAALDKLSSKVDKAGDSAKKSGASNDKFDRSLKDVKQSAKGAEDATEKYDDSVKAVTNNSTKASQSTHGFSSRLGKIPAIAGIVAAALAGLGIANLVSNSIEASAEVSRLTSALGMSAESLTSWQYMADSAGIGGEKMADIFKDINDRVGDFARTGAGPLADIMQQTNLDINELISLAPDEQFKKIYTELEKIDGISTAEKTFFLESLAGDASKLIPYLDDGAAGLDRMIKEAESLGLVMNDMQVERLAIVNKELSKVGKIGAGAGNALADSLAPAIYGVTNLISDTVLEMGGFGDISQQVVDGLLTGFGVVANVMQAFELALKSIEVGFLYVGEKGSAALAATGETGAKVVNAVLSPMGDVLGFIIEQYASIVGLGASLPSPWQAQLKDAEAFLKTSAKGFKEFKVSADDLVTVNTSMKESLISSKDELEALLNAKPASQQLRDWYDRNQQELNNQASAAVKLKKANQNATGSNRILGKSLQALLNPAKNAIKATKKLSAAEKQAAQDKKALVAAYNSEISSLDDQHNKLTLSSRSYYDSTLAVKKFSDEQKKNALKIWDSNKALEAHQAQLKKDEQARSDLNKAMSDEIKSLNDQTDKLTLNDRAYYENTLKAKGFTTTVQKQALKIWDSNKALKAHQDELKQNKKALDDLNKTMSDEITSLNDQHQKMLLSERDYYDVTLKAKKFTNKKRLEALAIWDSNKALKNSNESQKKAAAYYDQVTSAIKDQIAQLTLTKEEYALSKYEQEGLSEKQIENIEVLKEQAKAYEDHHSTLDSLYSGVNQWFSDMLNNGKFSFDSLADYALNMLKKMIADFATNKIMMSVGMDAVGGGLSGVLSGGLNSVLPALTTSVLSTGGIAGIGAGLGTAATAIGAGITGLASSIGALAMSPLGLLAGGYMLFDSIFGGDRPVKATFGGENQATSGYYNTKRNVDKEGNRLGAFNYTAGLGEFGVLGGNRNVTSSLGRYDDNEIENVHKLLDTLEVVDNVFASILPDDIVANITENLKELRIESRDMTKIARDRIMAIIESTPVEIANLIDMKQPVEEVIQRIAEIGLVSESIVPVLEDYGWGIEGTETQMLAATVAAVDAAGGVEAFTGTLASLKGAFDSIAQSFSATIEDLEYRLLGSNDNKYDFLQSQIETLYSDLKSADNVESITSLADEIRTLTIQSTNLLSDDQFQLLGADTIKFLEDVQGTANDRLDLIGEDLLKSSEIASTATQESAALIAGAADSLAGAVSSIPDRIIVEANVSVNVQSSGTSLGGGDTFNDPFGVDGSHADGLPYVPFDGYKAVLHRGEAVVPVAARQALSQYFNASPSVGFDATSIVNKLDELGRKLEQLRVDQAAQSGRAEEQREEGNKDRKEQNDTIKDSVKQKESWSGAEGVFV